MAIYLPGVAEESGVTLDELTPREIVVELDKYVVGQHEAKRAVAVALRNRMRRQKLPPDLAEEIMPKNIIMIGPTGVGKTEIARRLAKLANSPFLKVEASEFTEVGYVGRDVESMIRDLVEISIDMVREERLEEVAEKAEEHAENKLLDLLLPPPHPVPSTGAGFALPPEEMIPPRGHARNCASNSAKAFWMKRKLSWRCGSAPLRRLRSSPIRALKRWTSTLKTCCPTFSASAPRSAK